jgi:hypothetical protein
MTEIIEYINMKKGHSEEYLQFICKLKAIIKAHLSENLDEAFAAKSLLRDKYSMIDKNYAWNLD